MKLAYRMALAAGGAGLLAVVSGAFLSALPGSLGRLNLTLLLACGLIGVFRPAEALAAAVGAGLFWDALSAAPAGTFLLAGPAAVLLADLIFRRFLANLTWPSFAVLNAVSFVIYSVVASAVAAAASALVGWPSPAGLADWAAGLAGATLAQVVLSLVALWLSRLTFRWLGSRYFYSRYAR